MEGPLSALGAVVAVVVIVLWVVARWRRRQERRLMVASVDAMLAQLRSGEVPPILGLLRDLSTVLTEQAGWAERVEQAAKDAGRPGGDLDAFRATVAGLAPAAGSALVGRFVSEHLDPVEREEAVDHLSSAARGAVEWQPDENPTGPARELAAASVAGAAAELLGSLSGLERPGSLRGPRRPGDGRSVRGTAGSMAAPAGRGLLDGRSGVPRLDHMAELHETCERLHQALALQVRLARLVVIVAQRSGYDGGPDRDGLLSDALDRSAAALQAAWGRRGQSAVSALRLLLDARIPVPERGVPGERTRVALLDLVPWLQYIAETHRAAVGLWAAVIEAAVIEAAVIEAAVAEAGVTEKQRELGDG